MGQQTAAEHAVSEKGWPVLVFQDIYRTRLPEKGREAFIVRARTPGTQRGKGRGVMRVHARIAASGREKEI
jgi:hypothetical protein